MTRSLGPDDPLLARFHAGIYWDAFAAQHEPLAVWQRALRGELPYALTVRVALAGDELVGGIAFEHYPASGCGLVTYMVVAPAARGQGLGRALLGEAVRELHARGAPAVFGEVNDPRVHGSGWDRLLRFQRWGARVVDGRYVQPALAPGLARDPGLVLIVLSGALAGASALPAELPGAVPQSFVDELYAVTEGGPPPPEVAFGERVRLVELAP